MTLFGGPPGWPASMNDDESLLSELEALREKVEALLSTEDSDGDGIGAVYTRATCDKGRPMTTTELETQVEQLQGRIDRLEARQRQEIIRKAARFAADVRIANGHAPLSWDWDTRGAFEDDVRKYVDAELKELDQDEANALALAVWELAPSDTSGA